MLSEFNVPQAEIDPKKCSISLGGPQGCMQKFFQGGANLGYGQKRGGGSLCGVLHPTLAGGEGREWHKGANAPPRPPLNTALAPIF